MYPKGIVVVAVAKQGVDTALKIKNALNSLDLSCSVYAPAKYSRENVAPMDKKLGEFIAGIYDTTDAIVAVMATGIIIRAVAPCLKSKLVDPAVVGVDVSGRFAISLLSGHHGGANELAQLITKGIGATPVITTASDVMGKQSVDELARTLHLTIVNPDSLVAVNSAIVNDERVALVLVGDMKIPSDSVYGYAIEKAENAAQAIAAVNGYDAGAVIAKEWQQLPTTAFSKPVTILKPKTIVIGLGAKKDASEDDVLKAVDTALKRINLPLTRVDRLATVDIKRDSVGMMNAAKRIGLSFSFVSVNTLRAFRHEELSPDSKFVEEKIGVGGVCERAALITAGKNAHLVLKKMKMNGVTVAIAEAA